MGENIDLGDNVEFTIQTRNGKEVATNIIKLVAGTVVFEDVGTEYFRGQVLKVSSQKNWKKNEKISSLKSIRFVNSVCTNLRN